jgi:sugar lactone lactonase YvrE
MVCWAVLQTEIIAGSASNGSGCLDGVGTDARFNQPAGLCWDIDGSLLVADMHNHMIRRIELDQ